MQAIATIYRLCAAGDPILKRLTLSVAKQQVPTKGAWPYAYKVAIPGQTPECIWAPFHRLGVLSWSRFLDL